MQARELFALILTKYMALGDIEFKDQSAFGFAGDMIHQVAASATLINAGEPVEKVLGTRYVIPATNNFPVVGTDSCVGIAMSTSTNTAAADGTVNVSKLVPGVVYLIAPTVAATWDTQAKYDALVGDRVLLDLTAGVYTILAADGANNGCVIEQINIADYPGKVAFSIRAGASYLA